MSKISHLPKSVPHKDLPFKFKLKGSVNKDHTYEGDFVVRVPTGREMGRIGIEVAKLNDGIPLEMIDRGTANLHNSIAFLKVCLIQGPKWFMNTPNDPDEEGMDFGLDTLDVNIPLQIFKKANDLVSSWHKALRGSPNEEPETQG